MFPDPNLEALLQSVRSRSCQRSRYNHPALGLVPYPGKLRYYLTTWSQFAGLHFQISSGNQVLKAGAKDLRPLVMPAHSTKKKKPSAPGRAARGERTF